METDKPKYIPLLPKKLCILAKKKGFDWPTIWYYGPNGQFLMGQKEFRWDKHHMHSVLIPTMGTIRKWLKEVHGIRVEETMAVTNYETEQSKLIEKELRVLDNE